jgi:preprotein translocase subunit YajC
MTRISDFLPMMLGMPEGGASQNSGGQLVSMLVTFGLIILVFYFLVIRPQNKKQKDAQKMLASLRKGDRIVTAGGIHGSVVSVKETSVVVKVDDNTKLEFSKGSVTQVVERKDESFESKE